MPPTVSPAEFLRALWFGTDRGFVLTRTFDSDFETADLKFFQWPSQSDALFSLLEKPNGLAYVGAGLRSTSSADRAAVLGVSAFWTTVNLTDVPLDRAVQSIKTFPAKPSAGLIVGDALHVLWFLKTALTGDDLDYVWAANRTILPKLGLAGLNAHYDPVLLREGLQAHHYDFDGLLRAPGQSGAKFVAWRPEARYSIDEFADLVCPPKAPATVPPAAVPPVPEAIPEPPSPPSPTLPAGPTCRIDEDKLARIAEDLSQAWMDGPTAAHVAGIFARGRIVIEQAKQFVSECATVGRGDVARGVADVEATYRAYFQEGKYVTAYSSLKKLIADKYPPALQSKAQRTVKALYDLVSKALAVEGADGDRGQGNGGGNGDGGRDGEAGGFRISKFVKFDSRPARWSVTLTFDDGSEATACMETVTLAQFAQFQIAFYEQTHVMPPDFEGSFSKTQNAWRKKLRDAKPIIEVKETPREATPEGAIETAVDEFLSDAKENPDAGLLRSFAGYDAESRFFRYPAFRDFMKSNGLRIEDRVAFEHLKRLGFKNTVKRLGSKPQRLWVQAYEGNGNGNGNGHALGESGSSDEASLFGDDDQKPKEPGSDG